MNPNEENNHQDELMDSLLQEQVRTDREHAIQEIENAIMEDAVIHSKSQSTTDWRRLLISGSVAAAVVLGFGYSLSRFMTPSIQKNEMVEHSFEYKHEEPPVAHSSKRPSQQVHGTRPNAPQSATSKRITSSVPADSTIPLPDLAFSNNPADYGVNDDIAFSWGNGRAGGGVAPAASRGNQSHPHPSSLKVRAGLSVHENPNHTERYGALVDQGWQQPLQKPLSTFSIDVDNASYSNIRRMIREGRTIPRDAVRIEECINAFNYNYKAPTDDKAFAVHSELTTCPWDERNLLIKVGIKGREIEAKKRPVSNLVFLIDVSGSMQSQNKLPLVKQSLKLLVGQLDERDSVSYVVYAGSDGVVLPPTRMTDEGRAKAIQALERLEAGGSTNGGAGIQRAYQMAAMNFVEGGVNRVILASDGDFNVGVTGNDALVKLVKERAAKNIYLSALAFGTGNLNDSMFEAISNEGNGNYFYIDGMRESQKVFLQNLTSTLVTIAKDVKIQVEFNPQLVGSYRLIGYANRVLKAEDFNNDKVDAGDIGAGHSVTAFYEVVPTGSHLPNGTVVDDLKYQKPAGHKVVVGPSDEWLTLKLRHKHPQGDISSLQEFVLKGKATPWRKVSADSRFATAVALFGMKLRGMEEVSGVSWKQVRELAEPGLRYDLNEDRAEFVGLIRRLEPLPNMASPPTR